MRLLVIFLVAAVLVGSGVGPQKYKVLMVNSRGVTVNGREVKVGDVFDQGAVVRWTGERQAMKVMGLEDGRRYVITSAGSARNEVSARDALMRAVHTSTHDGGPNVVASPFDVLERSIAAEYDLLDSILIDSPLPLGEGCYFVASYVYGDTRLTKRLACVDGQMVIDRSLFAVDGKRLEPRDVRLAIDYVEERRGRTVFIKDDIRLRVLPLWVE